MPFWMSCHIQNIYFNSSSFSWDIEVSKSCILAYTSKTKFFLNTGFAMGNHELQELSFKFFFLRNANNKILKNPDGQTSQDS